MYEIGFRFLIERYGDDYSPEEVEVLGGVIHKGKKYLLSELQGETVLFRVKKGVVDKRVIVNNNIDIQKVINPEIWFGEELEDTEGEKSYELISREWCE